mmetsp:Transcript_20296/g.32703  ORF Transcript_20296/g.32703 Transcript_20296/m.32703 type:complete len:384 (-) Transcript_20296:148-1299(-)
MASQLVPIAPQPILLKIIRRMVKEPTNGKLRRLKMEKLRGKLNTASILALKNHGFKEENGLLCLPLGSEGDKKAQNLLTMLESLRNKAKMFQSDQDEKRVISDSKDTINAVEMTATRMERHLEIYRAVDPSQPPPSMWDSHVSAWRSAGKVLVDTLEAALKAHPSKFRLPTAGAAGLHSPLARINCCPGALLVLRSCGFIFTANSVFLKENAGASKMDKLRACIVEIRRKLLKDSHQTAKARASAIDRLAFSALKKKKKKKQQQQQQQQQKRGPGADVSAEDYKSNQVALGMRQRLKEATIRIDTLQALLTEKRDEFGEPFRIQWTVPNWKLRPISDDTSACFTSPASIEDSQGRRWRGYIRKPHGTGSRGRNDYGVGQQQLH